MLKWIETPSDISSSGGESGGDRSGDGGGGGGGETPQPAGLGSDKAITAFSFGISGEVVSIRGGPDQNGRTPIKVILPVGSPLNLTPTKIEIIGKSVSPQQGAPQNFSSPVVYTVTAQDGSTRQYVVEVSVKTPQSAEIIWFDVEIPGGGSSPVMAEGVVIQPSGAGVAGEIIVSLPNGTSLTSLTAKIAQTGTLNGPGANNNTNTAITLTSNFSNAVDYTVTPESGDPKTYHVTVIVAKSDVKEITAFSFAGAGTTGQVMIGAAPQPDGKIPIVVTVPLTTDLKTIQPTLKYKGAEVTGPGVSVSRTSGFSAIADVTGSQNQDFTAPRTYTVRAEDGSAKAYEVTVFQGDLNSGKDITGFYFILPTATAAGIIDQTAHTITVTVPSGTNLSSLTPTIYHTGVSVSPDSGVSRSFSGPVTYTVKAADNSTQPYQVSVKVAPGSAKAITGFDFTNAGGETTVISSTPGPDGNIPIVVTVPSNTEVAKLIPAITHTGASITGSGITGGSGTVTGPETDFSAGPKTYTVKAEDGSQQTYSVTVVKTPDPTTAAAQNVARIDGFYFNNPMAVGTINETAKTIAVTVPYGTALTNLIPTIYFTGHGIEKGSGTAYTGSKMSSPASIPADFSKSTSTDSSDPVKYTVTALDQNTTATYTVTVTVGSAPPASNVRAITYVGFSEISDIDTTSSTVSTVPDTSGKYPVEVIVPIVTNIGSLKPIILFKGVSISSVTGTETFTTTPHPTDPDITGAQASNAVSFTSPRTYRVTAANGQSSDYVVTVRAEDNNAKAITGFYFANPAAVGNIDESGKTITVTVPNGTALNGLVPTVYYTGASLTPASGTAVNFTSPVIYTVTARNGTAQPYTVRVVPKPASTKDITAISFPGAGVLETIIGANPDPGGYTPISVTVSAQTDIGALRPTITHTGASITPPGGTAQSAKPFTDNIRNFGSPQVYTVTAEDGSAKNYAVSVHISGGGAKIITAFVFKAVPVNGGPVVQVAGQINQDTATIEVRVPHAATDLTSLVPTITYLGKSAACSDQGTSMTNAAPTGQTGNTYTDNPRNFSGSGTTPLTYTVTAMDGSTQEYKVKVVKNPEVTVTYVGLKDDKFITEKFEQSTGLLTVTIAHTDYTKPYEWYVDGVKYPVSGAQSTLVLKTTDFQPGQHEVVAAAKKIDGKYYTNKISFLVKE